MTEIFNFHGLFHNSTDQSFIRRLDVDGHVNAVLDDAIGKIKVRLQPALFSLAHQAGVEQPYANPQFRLQGSKVYKTQNAPAHPPQQQVDVDLGVYLSAAFLDTASTQGLEDRAVPAKALAKTYFETADSLLKKLCQDERWYYAEGKNKKDTCCRIDLSPAGADAHIDVPLYAAPNEQFAKVFAQLSLNEQLMKRAVEARTDVSPELDRDGWDELSVVVMATRSGEWAESDVQVTIQHFREAAARSGHPFVLRRAWRYVKAWRDFVWRNGEGPSSILLMEAIVRIFDSDADEAKQLFESGRDDRIQTRIFAGLATQLSDNMIVQWGRLPEALNTADSKTRTLWAQLAKRCHENLHRCTYDSTLNVGQVIALVQEQFGQRIPYDPNLVKIARSSAAIAVATKPSQQPSPQTRVHRTAGA